MNDLNNNNSQEPVQDSVQLPERHFSFKILAGVIVVTAIIAGCVTWVVISGTISRVLGVGTTGEEEELGTEAVVGDKMNATDGWTTYRNEKDLFEVSYPNTFDTYGDISLVNFDINRFEKGNPEGIKIQIQKREWTGQISNSEISKLVEEKNIYIQNSVGLEGGDVTKLEPYEVGQINYKNEVLSGPGGSFDVYYSFGHSAYAYAVLVWGEENDPEIVRQILSTISFGGLSLEGWKTYRNEEYGFEINYPDFYGDFVEDSSGKLVASGSPVDSKMAKLKLSISEFDSETVLFHNYESDLSYDKAGGVFYLRDSLDKSLNTKDIQYQNGRPFTSEEMGEGSTEWWGKTKAYFIYDKKTNRIIELSQSSNPDTYNEGSSLGDMFSTLKFLD